MHDGPATPRPLSVGQRSRWFYQQLNSAAPGALNSAFAVNIIGAAPIAAIASALMGLLERHPMLRVEITEDGANLSQAVAKFDVEPLQIVDTRALGYDSFQETLSRACAHSFGSAGEPRIKATLFERPGDESTLLLVFDHLVVDGWSYWQLLKEFDALMTGVSPSSGDAPPESDRPAYFRYVAEQETWLASPKAQAQREYWRAELVDAPVLQLPYDRPRPAQPTGRAARLTATLAPSLCRHLKALARQQSATLFITMLAAYQIFLHRHAGQDDVVVGVPMPGRTGEEWDNVVGDFVNPIAVRTRFNREATVASLIRDVRGVALRGMASQQFPFSLVVEDLALVRDSKEHPIFQTMFAFQNARDGSALLALLAKDRDAQPGRWAGMDVTPCAVPYSGRLSDVPLILEVVEAGDLIHCFFKYDPDRFDPTTVARMAARFETVLMSMTADPAASIGTLDVLPEDEIRILLDQFSGRKTNYPHDTLMHLPFEDHAGAQPDATAVIYEDDILSYGELNARANRLAHFLIERGVKPGNCVGICLERGTSMVVGLLGILKAGGAYVPLDPGQPAERIRHILLDCEASLFLTQASLGARWPEPTVQTIHIDDEAVIDQLDAMPCVNSNLNTLGISPTQLAYVIYTSGSTGRPKGVMIEHAGIPRIFGGSRAQFQFRRTDVWTLFHSFAFDFSVWEMWGALLHGGSLVIVPTACAQDPAAFYTLLCQRRVTILSQTPSAFRQLVTAQCEISLDHSLRQIIFAGEALDLHTIERWFVRNDPTKTTIVNMYGATESTVHATYYAVPADSNVTALRGICGRPIAGYRIYVLNEERRPVPIGTTGDIYIGGRCVARGYMNRPDLAEERFPRDPFCDEANLRLYKTGDLGRFTADGMLEFLGRNDFQVKIRGFRIELGEIESNLAGHPDVEDVAVIAREDVSGAKQLVAYVTTKHHAALSLQRIREHLLKGLPDYMVPNAFVTMPALPLTRNGKLDRAALPPPDANAMTDREYAVPEGAVESELAALWTELLRVDRVGRYDDFFELGGHSLLAVQLAARIRDQFKIDIPLRELFDHTSLIALADLIVSLQLTRYSEQDISMIEDELRALSEVDLRTIVQEGTNHG
ncbi:amino acid adenylation domain-containing protein [Paraburkholderia metrosideri]|uniref:Amino acid adenylation domain-containing protein n=1 Tax=Paraburkholderia metrosideri TaxID=580937 RepID=A0ABW9DVS3_9BURK